MWHRKVTDEPTQNLRCVHLPHLRYDIFLNQYSNDKDNVRWGH